MSYGNITMLGDLPNLEDIENAGVGNPAGQPYQPSPNFRMESHIMERPNPNDEKFQKYIRSSQHISPNAGMGLNNPPPPQNYPQQEMIMQVQEQAPPPPNYLRHHCLDIAGHIHECPICSKFYNNDKTVYIIVIILLTIVCLMLLKRVLNV
jgi:hypothetical protein